MPIAHRLPADFPFPFIPPPSSKSSFFEFRLFSVIFFFSYSFIYFFFLLFSLFLIGRYLSSRFSFDIKLVESNHRLERNQHGRDTPDFFFFFSSFFFFTFHRSIRRLIVVFLRRLDTRKHIWSDNICSISRSASSSSSSSFRPVFPRACLRKQREKSPRDTASRVGGYFAARATLLFARLKKNIYARRGVAR